MSFETITSAGQGHQNVLRSLIALRSFIGLICCTVSPTQKTRPYVPSSSQNACMFTVSITAFHDLSLLYQGAGQDEAKPYPKTLPQSLPNQNHFLQRAWSITADALTTTKPRPNPSYTPSKPPPKPLQVGITRARGEEKPVQSMST